MTKKKKNYLWTCNNFKTSFLAHCRKFVLKNVDKNYFYLTYIMLSDGVIP